MTPEQQAVVDAYPLVDLFADLRQYIVDCPVEYNFSETKQEVLAWFDANVKHALEFTTPRYDIYQIMHAHLINNVIDGNMPEDSSLWHFCMNKHDIVPLFNYDGAN